MWRSKVLSVALFFLIAGCGESAADKAARAQLDQQKIAEQKKQQCLNVSVTSYHESASKPADQAYDILNVVNLEDCPDDLRQAFENYRSTVAEYRDASIAYKTNLANSGSDCAAGAGLSIVEAISGKDSGLHPCKDNFIKNMQLSAKNDTATMALTASNKELSQVFARYNR